ncbi:prophage CP4-like integrase [uncultured Gammaproteobacteria bacterium]|nr:prophage CP4-like integrase [uncultured Gammaproteobacteria bacterium]
MRDLDCYETQGKLITKFALQLLMLTFLRPSEVRLASWDEFDFNKRLWRIPAHKMKMKSEHLVPLSKQTIALLKNIQEITGKAGLLFPSHTTKKSISDNTMRLAMFKMGYDGNTFGKSRATPHGFRANASSILNEQGFNPDAIERQLSHIERDGVCAAYIHHARFLDDRFEMMQWWADYLDDAKNKI